jgi:hypothetical protein
MKEHPRLHHQAYEATLENLLSKLSRDLGYLPLL